MIERGEPKGNIIDRLTALHDEVAVTSGYDSFIINKDLEEALKELKAAIAGSNSGRGPDVSKYQKELVTLLQSVKEGADESSE